MQEWEAYKKQALKNDPELARLYDELEPEYQLASSLIEARIAKGLSQTELAQKAGVGQTVIARLESGTYNPTVQTVNKVAGVLGKELKLVGSK
jgi:DNA-binding XRE family transcriptional regulator